MPHLLARANEALLEAQHLRKEGRALRLEAAMRASKLGGTVIRTAAGSRSDTTDPAQPPEASD